MVVWEQPAKLPLVLFELDVLFAFECFILLLGRIDQGSENAFFKPLSNNKNAFYVIDIFKNPTCRASSRFCTSPMLSY